MESPPEDPNGRPGFAGTVQRLVADHGRDHVSHAGLSRFAANLHLAELRHRAALPAPHRLPEFLVAQSRRAPAHGPGHAQGPGLRGRDAARRLGMAAALVVSSEIVSTE